MTGQEARGSTCSVAICPAFPQDAGPAPAPPYKAEKCFGVAAAGQNNCQTANHSCAGESKTAAAGDSWIYVPAGTCMKINGGSPTPKDS